MGAVWRYYVYPLLYFFMLEFLATIDFQETQKWGELQFLSELPFLHPSEGDGMWPTEENKALTKACVCLSRLFYILDDIISSSSLQAMQVKKKPPKWPQKKKKITNSWDPACCEHVGEDAWHQRWGETKCLLLIATRTLKQPHTLCVCPSCVRTASTFLIQAVLNCVNESAGWGRGRGWW